MLAAVGHPVQELVRRQFGPVNLGTLRAGHTRDLTKVELGELLTISRQTQLNDSQDADRDSVE
jgi:23S rRNA pseudouridine2605 synthase/16S rRNA pseudouridine516 synthase